MAWVSREQLGQLTVQGIVDADPSAGAGLAAAVGSTAVLDTGAGAWLKVGAGATEWEKTATIETGDYAISGRFRATYDFATHGGAVGANAFGPFLPDNSQVLLAHYEVQTTFTSPTGPDNATVGLGVTTADATGIVAAAVINVGTPWDATGTVVDTLCDNTAAAATTKTAAARQFNLQVGVEDITAGRLVVTGTYHVGE